MENEKQLIEIISQKEGELRVGSETVIREAEQIVSRSRTEAARLIQMAEEEGKAAADDEYARQMQILDGDISRMKKEGAAELEAIQRAGTARLPPVAEEIISLVIG